MKRMRRMRRLLSMLLVCCMFFSLVPVTAMAVSVVGSGTCGTNVTWSLTSDGVLTISGTGAMTDIPPYAQSETVTLVDPPQPWQSSRNKIYSVVITEGVTSIANYAFYDCKYLKSITIPGSVKRIGESAFKSCSLTSVTLPEGITTIRDGAFKFCKSLTNITIPATVTYIGSHVFDYCSSLKTVSVAEDNTVYASLTGVLFNKKMTTLIFCPVSKTGDYTVPEIRYNKLRKLKKG